MPWLLTSPGHQQQWYWLPGGYVEYVGPGLIWGRILSTCVIPIWSNGIKCKYMFMFPQKNLARIGLRACLYSCPCHDLPAPELSLWWKNIKCTYSAVIRRSNDIDIDSALFNINTKTAQIMWCDEINSWNKNEWPMPPWSSFGNCIYVWRLLLRSLSNRWRRSHQKKEKEDIQG